MDNETINVISNIVIALATVANLIIIWKLSNRDKKQQKEILSFEKEKRKSDIKPRFKDPSYIFSNEKVNCIILNTGESAFIEDIKLINNPNELKISKFAKEVKSGESLIFDLIKQTQSPPYGPTDNVHFEYLIKYLDIDDNVHERKFTHKRI